MIAALLPALLVVAAGAASSTHGAEGVRALAEKAGIALEAWDLPGAQAAVDQLLHEAPQAPETAYFRGRVLFEQGKYEEAAKSLEEVQALGGREGRAAEGELRLAKAAAEETAGDDVHESEHFILRTPKGKDALLAPYALSALEKAYAGLTQDLGVHPASKIRVEVYESAKSLAHVSPLTVEQIKTSGTIALCKYSRLMFTSPKALLRGYPWLDTVSHEFVHYLVTQKGRNAVPIWLQEGLAKFLETRWRGAPGLAVDDMSLQLLQSAARKGTLIPFAKMHPSIAMLPSQEAAALAFAEVEAAIRLLYQRGGQAALTELVSAMASGMTDEQAVAQAYGKSFKQFEADWQAEVAKPRAKAAPQAAEAAAPKSVRPMVARKLVFKEDAKGQKDAATLEPEELDPEAKRAARLGELLFARKRWGAAAQEYGRAREHLTREVPQLSRRYAFAQLQVGKLDEAESALATATRHDPEDEAAQVLYAHVLVKRSAFDKARAAVEQGIAVDPFDPELHALGVAIARGLKDPKLEEQEKRAYALTTNAVVPADSAEKAKGRHE
jgi:tetratricopeptide (TPR) repeat protein